MVQVDGNEKRQKETKISSKGDQPFQPCTPRDSTGSGPQQVLIERARRGEGRGHSAAACGLARPAHALRIIPRKPGQWDRLHESHEREDTGSTGPYSVVTPYCRLAKRSPLRHTSPGTPSRPGGEDATAFRSGAW